MNNKKINFKRGFTLLEVLVSTSIFAAILIITTGIVAQSSTYRSKLKTMREVNEETRRIADQITRDVREANSFVRVTAKVNGVGNDVPKDFKNGLVLLKCNPDHCTFVDNLTPSRNINNDFMTQGNMHADTLVIATKSGYKVYAQSSDKSTVYYKGDIPITTILDNTFLSNTNNFPRINSVSTNTAVNFAGFCPDDTVAGTAVEQPYVKFYIISRTFDSLNSEGYDALPPTLRAQAELRSMVTSRSYNN